MKEREGDDAATEEVKISREVGKVKGKLFAIYATSRAYGIYSNAKREREREKMEHAEHITSYHNNKLCYLAILPSYRFALSHSLSHSISIFFHSSCIIRTNTIMTLAIATANQELC